jgi:hypothetical protein
MSRCAAVRPLLVRVADAAARPDEALAVARHASDCTACRILLARERRLSHLLERDAAELPLATDACVEAIMATLPAGPPPRRARRRALRIVETGALAGLALAGSAVVRAAWTVSPCGPAPVDFTASPETFAALVERVLALGHAVTATVEALAALRAPSVLSASLVVLGGASVLAATLVLALCAGGLATAWIARWAQGFATARS